MAPAGNAIDDSGHASSDGPAAPAEHPWQPSLFGQGDTRADADFSGLTRHELDSTAWVDHAAGWLQGADGLFEELLRSAPWESTTQELYGKVVVTPRLVARWPAPSDLSRLPPVIGRMRDLLVARYRRPFDSVSANLYRDGRDSVAWHRDHLLPALRGMTAGVKCPRAVHAVVTSMRDLSGWEDHGGAPRRP